MVHPIRVYIRPTVYKPIVPDFIVVLFKMTCYRLIKLSIIIIILVGGLCGSDLSGLSTGLLWIAIEWHCNYK